MKKMIYGISLLICLTLTACGNSVENKANTADTPQIQVEHQILETTPVTKTETEEAVLSSENTEKHYLPEAEANIGDETVLYNVLLNGVNVDVLHTPFASILEATGLQLISYATSTADGSFYFSAKGFGVPDDSMHFDGTTVFLETLSGNSLVTDFKSSECEDYTLLALHSSQFFSYEDFDVVYAGVVKAGASREEIELTLGEGSLYDSDMFGETVYYKNSSNTLLITYDSDNLADDIYLFNDFVFVE